MIRINLLCVLTVSAVLLTACSTGGSKRTTKKGSIGSLNKKQIKIEEPVIDNALEKAMQAYKQFLEETEEDGTAATPEAIRRLADLQLEAGAGTYDFVKQAQQPQNVKPAPTVDRARQANVKQDTIAPGDFGKSQVESPILTAASDDEQPQPAESQQAFESRATQISDLPSGKQAAVVLPEGEGGAELVNNNTEQAISLYKKLLDKYPLYERNDQVMYQLSRAYEEGGRQEEAKAILDKMVIKYPNSIHYDEAQFRRGEIFFVRRKYFDAEKAYSEVINFGASSAFYDQSLFKRGWSLFKQSLYEEAMNDFVALLDIKTAAGYHIQTESNKTEYQRVVDTFRVVSLSFSYIEDPYLPGDPRNIADYFRRHGNRDYEYLVYEYLGEHYLTKRRFQDSALVYNAFMELYPLHAKSPVFHMRTIDIYKKGNFPKLVIEAKRDFAERYDLNGNYWSYHDVNAVPKVLAFIKTNLNDLAKHYHALSQRSKKRADRHTAYLEAARWYRTFLSNFPEDEQAPELNFLLAELLFDNKAFDQAASEYERTAYAYPVHPKSAESGYAAILAYREYEKQAPEHLKAGVHNETIRSSLQFADTYPSHPEAAAVLTAAAENLYALKEYERAIAAAQKVISDHAQAKKTLITAAWIVVAHSNFDLNRYIEAEQGYQQVLALLPKGDKRGKSFVDKLAASVYQQAEQHKSLDELEAAVEDFLRIAQVAPQSEFRVTAEFDAATVLITLEDWGRAASVLEGFRKNYPRNKLQYDVTQKLAIVYQKSGQAAKAAQEYVRIADESDDDSVRKEALIVAAELYVEAKDNKTAIKTYRRYIKNFPDPIEPALEARQKLAVLYKAEGQSRAYTNLLKEIVKVDSKAGSQRSDRTRYLAAQASFVLAEPALKDFQDAYLGEPFQKTLAAKKKKMQKVLKLYGDMADYGIAEITAAATFQIAGVYYEFSVDLLESERPKNLSDEELAQYELILEEQAYPFEEKAIEIHQKNVELFTVNVYNHWIMKSLAQLATLLPVRYAKTEEGETFVEAIY